MLSIPQHKNASVNLHNFAMIPRADIPRSSFDTEHTHKTAFNSGYLIPIYLDEVLPGDSHSLRMTGFYRLATPLVPSMDNVRADFFFFFIPYRLIWTHFVNMQGEQDNPGDTTSYTTPQVTSPVGGWTVGSLQDYLGLPTVGQIGGGNTITHSNLPMRAYNLVWNQHFRDENLQNSVTVDKGDGPDTAANYVLLQRGKRKDYFTGALPWPQKGATAVSLPLGSSAPVVPNTAGGAPGTFPTFNTSGGPSSIAQTNAQNTMQWATIPTGTGTNIPFIKSGLMADLSSATAATINSIRLAFQTQKMLERDARGGTRYAEALPARWGVISADARLQRPEYLGGGSCNINITPIPQTSQTGLTGGTTPIGTLAATAAGVAQGIGFTQSFTEHGLILGLCEVRADLSYQQGMRRMWSRLTRLDHFEPVFGAIGEMAILNKEIYCDGSANDANVFGYQEAWADYRYHPSLITGLFRSTSAGTIDYWHLAQKFNSLPTLNTTFIKDTPPLQRIMAVGAGANGQEIIADMLFKCRKARNMPMYSVPGMVDHF